MNDVNITKIYTGTLLTSGQALFIHNLVHATAYFFNEEQLLMFKNIMAECTDRIMRSVHEFEKIKSTAMSDVEKETIAGMQLYFQQIIQKLMEDEPIHSPSKTLQ